MNFEGDLLLADTPDGGDILIQEGLFHSDTAFDTAVYLSLFGGNKDDEGKVKNGKTWWGNLLPQTPEAEKMVSRLQAVITGTPLSAKNVRDAENAARLDLRWLVDAGMADAVLVDGRGQAGNRFSFKIEIRVNGNNVFDNTFVLFWRK
jgi:phage gp46-like protein